jgi:membrane fusion protein (multidrug efflux system)
MKNRIIIGSIIALGILQSCASHEKKDEKPVAATVTVETFLLQKDKFSTSLQLPGELIAFQQVDLYAKVTSFVKELNVDIGSEVTAGELLMTMEAPELNSQLSAAESRLKSLEANYTASSANYNRLTEAGKTPGTVSQNDLDQATARKNADYSNLEAAKASYKEIGVMKSYLEIRAPFSGIISSRNVNPGAYVGPSGKGSELPLLTLQEQKHLRLSVSIPEAYTNFLKANDVITFKVKSLPAETFTASVKRMAGALDLHLRSERVEMDMMNADKKLLPGMVAEVSIPLSSKDSSFVVPKSALVNSNEGIYVIKVVTNKTLRVPVKKGREIHEKIEIFGDLVLNEQLLTKANEEIKDGTPVK